MNELIGVITPDNTYNISGEVSGESTLSGIVTGGAQYEAYSGSYSVTPSGSVQTLETDGKLMTDDVTVGAIPSDYIGTDIPRRSTISVSQDNNTIHVEDGYYEDDIDASMGACTVTGASVLIDNQGDATGSIIVGRGGYINSGSHTFYVDDVVTPRSSSDLTASGATVSVPYGYYSADASKTVASGSAGTPTATKGSVSNHAVNVTPSVTNTEGYITGGTVTGTAVSVSASELVSGNKAITENGTGIDVTNYSTVSVDVQSGSTVSVVDTTDSGGGTVRTITASGTTIPTPASDISKLILNGVTQMDVTDTTATVSDVASGKVFTQVDGTTGTGTASGGISVDDIAQDYKIEGDITISLTASEYLRAYCFYNTKITSVTAPNVARAAAKGNYFAGCTSLVSASLPSLIETSTMAMASIFASCSKLETVDMPYAWPRAYAFDGCTKLKKYVNKISSGSNTNIEAGAFRGCRALEVLDFTHVNQIAATWAYDNSNNLTTLILRRTDAVVPCSNANNLPPVFRNNGAGGEIYVPSSLIESYKTATNWSTAFAYGTITFKAIEGSYYETHYADGTLVT